MTSAELSARYRVHKLLSEQSARTYIAQEIALGRAVMVHYLDRLPVVENQRLLDRLADLPTYAQEKIVEITEVEGITVVVTLFIAPFHGLQAWLDRIDANRTNPKGARPPSWNVGSGGAPAAARPAQPIPPTPAPVASPPPPAAPQAPAPRPAKPAPGEFTRIFGAQDIGSAPVAPTSSAAAAPPPLPPAPMPPAAPPPPFPSQAPASTPAPDVLARSAPPSRPAPDKPAESFTAIFGAPQLPVDQPPPAPKSDFIVPPAMPSRRGEPAPSSFPPSLNDFGGFDRPLPPPHSAPSQAPPPLPPVPPTATPAPRAPIAHDIAGVAGAAAAAAAAPAAAAAAGAIANKNQPPARPPSPPLPDPGLAASAGAGLIGSAGVGSAMPRSGSAPSAPPRMAGAGLPPGPRPAAAPIGGAPSDYTRVIRPNTPMKPAPPVSPGLIKPTPGGAQAGAGGQTGQRDWMPIVIGLGVIALIALGLVIVFLLRHK